MALILDGTNGVDKIAAGAIESADLPAGSVLQVVMGTTTTEASNAGGYADTNLTATITPKFATSKVLVLVNHNGCQKYTNATYMDVRLLRAGSSISEFGGQAGATGNTTPNNFGSISLSYLDSPATTSATIYKTQFKSETAQASVRVQNNSAMSTITLIEVAA